MEELASKSPNRVVEGCHGSPLVGISQLEDEKGSG